MTPTVESIWNEFAAKLGQFIAARVADPATAEDILQDVFLKIQTRLGQLQDPAKLQGWLYLMTRNAIIDHHRLRKLDLRYASFAVLTPFPGTQLYAERQKELLSQRHELFDLLHTLLPTKLPLPEFYSEFAALYDRALPLRYRLGGLRRYGLRDSLRILRHTPEIMRGIRNGHLDYDGQPDETGGNGSGQKCGHCTTGN